jgi:ankyrin repeat protein
VKAGDAQLVARLLGEGRDVNEADEFGCTALIYAAALARAEVVRLLLAPQGVEVKQATELGYSALIIASLGGQLEVVRLLLAHQGVQVNKCAADGATA